MAMSSSESEISLVEVGLDDLSLSEEPNVELTLSSLKAKLGLDKWMCGVIATTTGKPCGKSTHIKEKQQKDVDAGIRRIISILQSPQSRESPSKIQNELKKIIDLVHCGIPNHKKHETKEARALTMQMALDGVVAPIEEQLGNISSKFQCLSFLKSEPNACYNHGKVGGRKAQNINIMVDEIVKREVYSNTTYLSIVLKHLEPNLYCKVHDSTKSPEPVKLWVLEKLRTVNIEEEHLELLAAIANGNLEKQPSLNSVIWRWSLEQFESHKCALLVTNYEKAPFESVDKVNYGPPRTLVEKEMIKSVKSMLGRNLARDGYIYLYKVEGEGNQNFVKIGSCLEPKKPEQRLEEWTIDCNRETIPCYPNPLGSATKVPNAEGVEKLCHAELGDFRIRYFCRGCQRNHDEWFETTVAKGIEVIKRWSGWMENLRNTTQAAF